MTEARPNAAIRAFVALELPLTLRGSLAGAIDDLRPGVPNIRWMDPEHVHLTMRFLGWTTRERLPVLEKRLSALAAATPSLASRVSELGLFPPSGRARVLWIGASLPAEGLKLQADCEAAAVASGFPPERREFKPHLTLGRWRDPAARPKLPAVDLGRVVLDRLTLFRSELRANGAEYSPLAVFPLG